MDPTAYEQQTALENARYQAQREKVIKELSHSFQDTDGKFYWRNPKNGKIEPLYIAKVLEKYCLADVSKQRFIKQEDYAWEKKREADKQRYMEQRRRNEAKVDIAHGNFTFLMMRFDMIKKRQHIAPQIGFETLARLAILSGYLAYNSQMILRVKRGGRKKAAKRHIRKILNLAPATFDRFWKEATTQGYITGSDEEGYQLSKLFVYGRVGNGELAQRVYTDILEKLYYSGSIEGTENTSTLIKATDHKKIGKVLALTPYIHVEENILCWNPWVEDKNKIDPLTDRDIADILKSSPKHAAREVTELCRMTFCMPPGKDTEDKDTKKWVNAQMYFLARMDAGCGGKTFYVVNPAIVYYGTKKHYYELMESAWMYVKPAQKGDETIGNVSAGGPADFWSDIFR